MQITGSRQGRRRPFVHSVATMAVVASAIFAVSADAQGDSPRPPRAGRAGDAIGPRPMYPMGEMRPHTGQRGGGNGNPASALLRMRQQLDLTDDQVKRLEVLQAAPAPPRNESDALRARADLMDATRGDGNIGAARTALDKMSRVRNERVLAGLKARQEARNVLTAAQKLQLDNIRGEMRDRARGAAKRQMQGGGREGVRQGMRQGMRPGMRPGAQRPMPPLPPRRRGDNQN